MYWDTTLRRAAAGSILRFCRLKPAHVTYISVTGLSTRTTDVFKSTQKSVTVIVDISMALFWCYKFEALISCNLTNSGAATSQGILKTQRLKIDISIVFLNPVVTFFACYISNNFYHVMRSAIFDSAT